MPPAQSLKPVFRSFLFPPPSRRSPPCLLHPQPPLRFYSHDPTFVRTKRFKDHTFPNDFGLANGTFIMPRSPSFLSSPLRRLKLYRHRLFKIYEGFRMMLSYKFGIGATNPRPRLAWREMRKAALDLHKQTFTALAAQDTTTLQKICCTALLTDLKSRIANQKKHHPPPGPPPYRWTLHKYSRLRPPRVVSSRAVAIPMVASSGFRQHVIRICSVQSLDPLKAVPPGETAPEVPEYTPGPKKTMREYIVVQRIVLKGKERPWLVWGSVPESDAKKVMEEIEGVGIGARGRTWWGGRKRGFIDVEQAPAAPAINVG